MQTTTTDIRTGTWAICLLGSLLSSCTDPPAYFNVDEVWTMTMSRFDKDASGDLDSEEFHIFQGMDPAALRFEQFDLDNDSRLTVTELAAQLTAREPRPLVDKPHKSTARLGSDFNRDRNDGAKRVEFYEVRERDGRVPGYGNERRKPKRSGPPNIILVSLDTVRADHMSLYGYPRPTTPFLDALAQKGTVFENAFSVGNESAYSHAAMLTSRYPSEVAAPIYRDYVVPESETLLGEILQAYGYETAGFIAGGHVSDHFGFDQGFDTFSAEVGFASFWHTTAKALGWLDERTGEKPWFLMVHGYDAHRPYVAPAPFTHLFSEQIGTPLAEFLAKRGGESEKVYKRRYYPSADNAWIAHTSGVVMLEPESYDRLKYSGSFTKDSQIVTSEDVEHLQAHYDSMLAYADLQIGLFFADVAASGLLENTIVLITGDHGEDLLDHDFINHRTALTDSCVHVAMIAIGPGFPAGTRNASLVDLLDIVPTALFAAGAEARADGHGQPLQSFVAPDGVGRDAVFFEGVLSMLGIRTATHKLAIHHTNLTDPALADTLSARPLKAPWMRLYDLTTDPRETTNLLDDPDEHALAVAETLRTRIVEWRRETQVNQTRGDIEKLDPALRQELKEHGYWEMGLDDTEEAPESPEPEAP